MILGTNHISQYGKERDPLIQTLQLGSSMLCSSSLSQPHASGSEPWDISWNAWFSVSFFEDFTNSCRRITPLVTPAPSEPTAPLVWQQQPQCSLGVCRSSPCISCIFILLRCPYSCWAPAFSQGHSEHILLTLSWQEAFRGKCRLEQLVLPASDYFSFYRPAGN